MLGQQSFIKPDDHINHILLDQMLNKPSTQQYYEQRNKSKAVDPHSFFADPDPAIFLNADPDPAWQNCEVTLNVKKIPYEELPLIDPLISTTDN